jgi:ParB-like nuclease domain
MKKIEIHEAANAFRLMNDEELVRLALDISEHGLRDPITIGKLNGSEKLVDGRNRLKACEMAGVEPQFEIKEFASDDEIRAFIGSRSERRDVTAGQRAMAMAFLYPEPDKRGRGNKGKSTETSGFSQQRLRAARQVLRYSREVAEEVRDGTKTLDEALVKVKTEQEYKDSGEYKLAQLEKNAPDLAEQVREERLSLNQAYAAFEEGEREAKAIEKEKRETILRVSEAAYRCTTAWAIKDFVTGVEERLLDKEFLAEFKQFVRVDHERLKDISIGAKALQSILQKLYPQN